MCVCVCVCVYTCVYVYMCVREQVWVCISVCKCVYVCVCVCVCVKNNQQEVKCACVWVCMCKWVSNMVQEEHLALKWIVMLQLLDDIPGKSPHLYPVQISINPAKRRYPYAKESTTRNRLFHVEGSWQDIPLCSCTMCECVKKCVYASKSESVLECANCVYVCE